jgi:tetratricopeptide (TPR) repeat protein
MPSQNRCAKVFLCHASEDKHLVHKIYNKLKADGFEPWLDKEDLLPGQLWKEEIPRVIHSAACMLVFLSATSIEKRGYVQKEFRLALETLDEIPEGQIFLIPVRIDDCKIPNRFAGIHYCDLFEEDGYERIVKALRKSITNELSDGAIKESIIPWNLPLSRNLFFVGREEIIKQLRNELKTKDKVALSGIPGVGKTQIALEYAYRYGKNYRAVLWSRAENKETLVSSFLSIARLLNLPEKDDQEKDQIIQAVKKWLSKYDRWLLVFDNVDDLPLVRDFIPIEIKGHILLTTRAQTMGGMAQRISITPMIPTDGARYLLYRSGILSSKSAVDTAKGNVQAKLAECLSIELGGLPLALDQAGAFMEENSIAPDEYLSLYKEEGKQLRQERGQHDTASQGHSKSVTITFTLAFRKLIDINPAAAELLRLCAFLYPEQIPENVLLESAKDLGEALSSAAANKMDWINTRQAACRFSLLKREIDNKSLNIHRVVQSVLKDEMNKDIQKKWAKRAIRIINRGFPDTSFENWPDCERLISQARTCASLIVDWKFAFPEAGRLLIALADYNHYRGRYGEAETLYNYAIGVREKIYGKNHPKVGTCINNLAVLYYRKGRYEEAERLYKKDIDIQKQCFGTDHQNVGTAMNNLAEIYRLQGKYDEAEDLYRRALEIIDKTLGTNHPNTADILNNMGLLFWHEARYNEAEQLCKRALAIRYEALESGHPAIADSLTNLASIYRDQNKFVEAEPLFRRALELRKEILGSKHPDVANSLKNLGLMYTAQKRYQEAERSFQQALNILKEASAINSQDAKTILKTYAQLLKETGQKEKTQMLKEHLKLKEESTIKEVIQ